MERLVTPEEFISMQEEAVVIDVRREDDYQQSVETISGAQWKNPSLMDEWVAALPKDKPVVVFCVRGGGVSNSVVDRLQAEGVAARFIEGGIEGARLAGCVVAK